MQDFNYHTHTYRCLHSDQSISDEEYIQLLIDQGFKHMCFTDHCPHKTVVDTRDFMRMRYEQKEEYYKSVLKLKEKYKNQIKIQLGFEVEFYHEGEQYLKQLKSETEKIILGQHFVFDKNNRIKFLGYYDSDDNDIVTYADYIKEAIEKGIPDVVAHPDFFMYRKDDFTKNCEYAAHTICKAAEKYNVPLEINLTQASLFLRNRVSTIAYPCKKFWEIASNYNIKVIYGVDAHFREQINQYKESIDAVNKHLGEEVMKKLNFIEKAF